MPKNKKKRRSSILIRRQYPAPRRSVLSVASHRHRRVVVPDNPPDQETNTSASEGMRKNCSSLSLKWHYLIIRGLYSSFATVSGTVPDGNASCHGIAIKDSPIDATFSVVE